MKIINLGKSMYAVQEVTGNDTILIKFFNSIYRVFKSEAVSNFLLFLFVELIYLTIVQLKSNFDLSELYVWLFILRKIIFDWLLYIVGSTLILKLVKNKFTASLYSAIYVFLVFADSAIYLFGNTLFQKVHLKLIASYSLNSFVNLRSVVLVLAMLFIIPILVRNQIKTSANISDRKIILYMFTLLLLWFFNFPSTYLNHQIVNINKMSGLNAYTLSCQGDQLRYVTQNSMIHFFEELFYNQQSNMKLSNDVSAFAEVIKTNNLPVGERKYNNLGLKRFKKIILFTSESLSLDLLSDYNKKLSVNTSTFYGSKDIKDRMFTNYRTSAHNTLEGLLATFNSHPNTSLFNARSPEFFRNSFVNILKQNGYDTIFLRSASKYYANENVYFKNVGFKNIIAREDFEKIAPKYIDGWGISDRIMYQRLVDILKAKKDEKLFITVLGTDTHPLDGRKNYQDLQYPPVKGDFDKFGKASKYLQAIAKHDYDMGETIKKIKEMGLLTDDTLIILTADHACPLNDVVESIDGYPKTSLARIPLVFITGQKLPDVDKKKPYSQLDLAPTILHLLNLKVPEGYWGDSIFANNRKENYIGYDRDVLYFENRGKKYQISLHSENEEDKKTMDFFKTLIVSDMKK